jgi:hypothetical protein
LEKVQQALEWALALGDQLGLHFQPLKIFRPTTTLEYLGISLTRKPSKLVSQLKSWLTSKNSSLNGLTAHT